MAERKIKSIGLALSGGGYRAAGFHLGAMDMLARLGLMDRVKGLSTVSGGTITGAYYALATSRGKRPEEIFPALAGWLFRNDVIDRALKEHPATRRHAKSRRRDLITSASEVYNDMLQGALFGELFDHSGHLEDVIFNATEFHTGLDFRFQKTDSAHARIGNGNWYITRDVARQLRLADIVAASSCFPSGFEPLEFPADFVFPGAMPDMPKIPPHFAIMDGGVYDNQGSEALLLERAEREAYDLVIVSDTDQKPRSAFYSMPARTSDWRGLNVGLIVALIALLGAATVGGAVNNIITLLHSRAPWWEMAVDLLPSVVAGGFFITLYWAWRKVRGAIAKKYPNLAGDLRTFLFSLRWADLVDLVSLRLGSLVAMASSIFLKRIRALGYDRLYTDDELNKKVVSNLIYGMASKIGKSELAPTPDQQALSERANQMATTLWFDDEKQLRDVVACGQNSVVHALLRWMERGQKAGEGAGGSSEDELTAKLRQMWNELQEDPFRFVPSVGQAGGTGTVKPLSAGVGTEAAAAAPKRETA